jgi:hypothetical protein
MSCCEPDTGKRSSHGCCDCAPTCYSPHGFTRHFVTDKERRECLERYREELKKEIAGVDERIGGLEGSGK